MRTRRSLPIAKPFIGNEELEAIQEPLRTGWLVQGPQVRAFEDEFGSYVGGRNAVAASSCTTALHLAVLALDLHPGDEVIVPAFTWISTANIVEYAGATPIFCDIDQETFNIDVDQIAGRLTDRTVGILPVHLFGLCADMDPVITLAGERGLWVLEDAACAFGATYAGKHAGTLADAGCFSFHPRKSITTGEGGMLTTNRDDIAERARSLRDHGATRSDWDRHTAEDAFLLADYDELGFNYRMTDLQAAVGRVQLGRAAWILRERRRLATSYDRQLAGIPWLALPNADPEAGHAFQAYVCLFQPEAPDLDNVERLFNQRNRLMRELATRGVSTRPGTHAAALQNLYARKYALGASDFPRAFLAERLTLALPLYAGMTDDDVEYVVAELNAAFETL